MKYSILFSNFLLALIIGLSMSFTSPYKEEVKSELSSIQSDQKIPPFAITYIGHFTYDYDWVVSVYVNAITQQVVGVKAVFTAPFDTNIYTATAASYTVSPSRTVTNLTITDNSCPLQFSNQSAALTY